MMFKNEKSEKLIMLTDIIVLNMNINEKCLLKFLTNPISLVHQTQDNLNNVKSYSELVFGHNILPLKEKAK